MLFYELRCIIALAIAGIATYTDIRERLIYDRLTYPSIALGALFSLADLIFEHSFIGFLFAFGFFAFSYALYYMGKIGGGDVKLFVALALLVPGEGTHHIALEAIFYAALLSTIAITLYGVFKILRERAISKKKLALGISLAIIVLIYIYLMHKLGSISFLGMIILSVPLALSSFFLVFTKEMSGKLFLRYVSIDELEEDEILAKEYASEKLLALFGSKFKGIIGEKEKEKLKKARIKRIPVYRALPPFAPFVLVGLIISIFLPKLFLSIFPYIAG